jgi:hypothetical protein
MTMDGTTGMQTIRAGRIAGLGWWVLAVVACLWVLAVNGRPLFYWDTVGYIDQGIGALEKVRLIAPQPKVTRADPQDAAGGTAGDGQTAGAGAPPTRPDTAAPSAADPSAADPSTAVPAGDGASAASADAADPGTRKVTAGKSERTVDGSRSIFYSVVMGTLAHLRALELIPLIHAVVVIAAVWLSARAARRIAAPGLSGPATVALPLAAAALGSMPFYVAYLMPDIFAPVMVLSVAALTAFLPRLTWAEALGLSALAAIALVSHLSHLAIALLLVPTGLLVAAALRGGRWWLLALLMAGVIGAGFAQQAVIRLIAEKVANSEVVIKPFITARLIQDKVGYRYLETHCPDPEVPTCALWSALQKSPDPYRLTASHIIFERSERLGSFRLMTEDDQIAVARNQMRFFFAVLRDQPVGTVMALLKNTLIQAGMTSVNMTVPSDVIVKQHADVDGLAFGRFGLGRLGDGSAWLAVVNDVQGVWYAACLAVVAILMLRPRGAPAEVRVFVLMILLGLLANAFVCGAISQPATRYGSRVVWLLPVAAAFLLMFRGRSRA